MPDTRCDTIRDHIDAFLDGELDAGERALFEAHCAGCHACARELRLAARIHGELLALPALDAPARVIDAAARETGRPGVPPLRVRRLVLPAVAAALAVAAAAAWFISNRGPAPEPEFSDAEIRRASEDMALAFAYVDRYSAAAADLVRDDVMEKRVVPRIERALVTSGEAAIHDALVPGLKRAVRESGLSVTSPAHERS